MGEDLLPDPVRERFASHVAAIVGHSAIPAADRGDVAEELLGHLVTRFNEARSTGLAEDDAASEAIAGFGSADVIARDFMDAYRGRLWASTIGQLLPVAATAGDPPGMIVWIVRFDRAMAIFSAVAAVALGLTLSPVRALAGLVIGLGAAAILWLAAIALRRGQGWALAVSAFALLVNAVIFFASLGQPPGGWTISINGLVGLFLLIWLLTGFDRASAWVADSRPIGNRLGWPIGLPVIAWALVAGFAPNLPDPTQIGPADVEASAAVTCTPTPGTMDDGTPFVPSPTIVLEVVYHRADLAPRGVIRDGSSWGDTIEVDVDGFAHLGAVTATSQAPGEAPKPIEVDSIVDRPAAWIDSGIGPGYAFDEATADPIVAEILGSDQLPGRTIRIEIPTMLLVGDGRPSSELGTPVEGMSAVVRLRHLDRFALWAHLDCGQQGRLAVVDS